MNSRVPLLDAGDTSMDAISFYEQLERHARPLMLKNLELLKPEEFTRPMPFLGGRSPRDVLAHAMETEIFWMQCALQGKPRIEFEQYGQYPDVESVRKKWEEVAAETKEYLRGLTPEILKAEKSVDWGGGIVSRFPLWLAIYQVITHEFHHKGQLMSIVRGLGYEPEMTDFV
jgi:uncharacterized damage-inducible protein DinB